jgi:MoaA/NifB/PqqE/SkfB family radical SAM enzyme
VVARFNREETARIWGVGEFPEDIPSPEVVHLEISARCNLDCPYCYAEKDEAELPREKWEGIIDRLADAGVFQVTFGGGEPLLREDLPWLAERARKRGLDVNMTTNGLLVPERAAELDLYSQVNVSYHGNAAVVAQALGHLEEKRIRRGVNLVMKRSYADKLDFVAAGAGMYGAELLLLTYKTRDDLAEVVPPAEVLEAAKTPRCKTAVDGSALGECWANYRFADVDSRGRVMPCSFIREPMGDLTAQDFGEVWRGRERYRKCPYFAIDNAHCWADTGVV